ncbi:MAG: flagellar motor protein MotA [Proteobacteria bacterium]|nr:flagellar motor protein MotA [Pseudomonadota bacterium]MDA1058982.1 flagellar motor protein MotA [Pseudomonadota bacterium]
MTGTRTFLTRMIIFLVIAAAVILIIIGPLRTAFMANPAINGLILGVLLLGIVYAFRQVLLLHPEVRWIETFRRSEPGLSVQEPPTLLGPMATMLGDRTSRRMQLSTLSMRSLLDGISSRLDESRDISRYMIGLLVFLGLLGTFWGLLQTIGAVGSAISALSVDGGDFSAQFDSLRRGLEAPLTGMGTAFSSSLFGLGGSLVLGFLDLQAGQAQNRFYNDLEEWLSSVTRLSSGGGLAEGDQSVPAYVQALLEQTAESLDNLQRTMTNAESGRHSANQTFMNLAERLATLTDQMRSEQDLMVKLIESQLEMKPVLQKLAEDRGGIDKSAQTHLRNMDVYLSQLLDATTRGQEQLASEIRNELKLVARTIAATLDKRRD